jgi:hypothetical protein
MYMLPLHHFQVCQPHEKFASQACCNAQSLHWVLVRVVAMTHLGKLLHKLMEVSRLPDALHIAVWMLSWLGYLSRVPPLRMSIRRSEAARPVIERDQQSIDYPQRSLGSNTTVGRVCQASTMNTDGGDRK